MIYISTGAGVRMAKAGKAYEKAQHDLAALHTEPGFKDFVSKHDALDAASFEMAEAIDAVMAELHAQNLHNMTDPA